MKFLLVNFGRMKLPQMENLVIVGKISETFPPLYVPEYHRLIGTKDKDNPGIEMSSSTL